MLLEPIYETAAVLVWLPARTSAHDALSALRTGIIEQRQRWVIDADIDEGLRLGYTHPTSGHSSTCGKDGVARRMIDKWLKAGVLKRTPCTGRWLAPLRAG